MRRDGDFRRADVVAIVHRRVDAIRRREVRPPRLDQRRIADAEPHEAGVRRGEDVLPAPGRRRVERAGHRRGAPDRLEALGRADRSTTLVRE
jgi:hypothetical protein